LNRFVDLYEILYGGDAIAGNLDGINLQSHSYDHYKMVEIQICVVNALPATFSITQQWTGIV
jgi:hypothetical protein